jgi:hypothetical protein
VALQASTKQLEFEALFALSADANAYPAVPSRTTSAPAVPEIFRQTVTHGKMGPPAKELLHAHIESFVARKTASCLAQERSVGSA